MLMLFVQDGYTALHYACYGGDVRVVEMLLNHGIDVKAVDKVSDGRGR